MNVIYMKSNESSSKTTSEQVWKEAECQAGNGMVIVKIPVTYTMDAMYVDSDTAISVRLFNISDYHHTALSAYI